MPTLEIDDLGLSLRWGALEIDSYNGTGDLGGGFYLRLPLGALGVLVWGYDPDTGWELFRLSVEDERLVNYTLQAVRELQADPDSWWHLDGPTDEALEEIEEAFEHLDGPS